MPRSLDQSNKIVILIQIWVFLVWNIFGHGIQIFLNTFRIILGCQEIVLLHKRILFHVIWCLLYFGIFMDFFRPTDTINLENFRIFNPFLISTLINNDYRSRILHLPRNPPVNNFNADLTMKNIIFFCFFLLSSSCGNRVKNYVDRLKTMELAFNWINQHQFSIKFENCFAFNFGYKNSFPHAQLSVNEYSDVNYYHGTQGRGFRS